MKSKVLSGFFLTLVLSLVMITATDLISLSNGPSFTQANINSYFDITSLSDATNIVMNNQVIRINDGNNNYMTVTLNPSSVNQQLGSGASVRVNAVLVTDQNFVFDAVKTYTFPAITVSASRNNGTGMVYDNKTITLKLEKTFCKYGENGTALSLSEVKINNVGGDDDLEWKPLDSIKVTVKVENNGDDNVRKVYAEIGLINSKGKNIVKDLENLADKKISLGTINDGDEKTATFEFNAPVDFTDEDYELVVKAYSEDEGEKSLCTSSSSDLGSKYYETISGIKEDTTSKQVILNNIQLSSETAACGDNVQLSGTVYNIGDEDYTDQIKVTLVNKELGLNQEQIIRDDLNQGDSLPVDFDFNVPLSAKEKTYTLEFRTYYDYNTNSDSYGIQSDRSFVSYLKVAGNCQNLTTTPELKITAQFNSETPEAVAGKELIIDATVKNTGTSQTSWALSVVGNSEWSTLDSIEPQALTLAAGETKQVSIKLLLDKASEGDKEFTIRATKSDKTIEQAVNLTITPATNTFAEHLKANWFIYVIVIVNIILIIAIIMVIRRIIGSKD